MFCFVTIIVVVVVAVVAKKLFVECERKSKRSGSELIREFISPFGKTKKKGEEKPHSVECKRRLHLYFLKKRKKTEAKLFG